MERVKILINMSKNKKWTLITGFLGVRATFD